MLKSRQPLPNRVFRQIIPAVDDGSRSLIRTKTADRSSTSLDDGQQLSLKTSPHQREHLSTCLLALQANTLDGRLHSA